MKTTMIFRTGMAMLLVIGLSVNNFASNDPTSSTVTTMEESTFGSMQINVPSDMETYVSLFDQDGDMIYTDIVIKDDNAGKKYDFSEVENGVYTFKTVTEHKIVETTFEVGMNDLRVLEELISYRPVFWMDGDIISVSYMNLDKDNLYISLDDGTYQYYEENSGSDMSFGKMFNIKNLSKGEYSLTLKSGENTYNYFFNK